ncbi:hypothetical protein OCU04_008583 [Sclerotinia nivalis]|uniref:DUF7730 domain-containing protein n=1 Tax=Sclerotinia nivalis TaxID=352851 RepID=A0A9X0AIP2_9HELO|nr:hypothetical protein OCU04_008583 [Sclerotinia nivalis]
MENDQGSDFLKLVLSKAMQFFTSGSVWKDWFDPEEITNRERLNPNDTLPVTNQSPFLRLPPELRILIYNELIPNEYIRSNFSSHITPGRLRNRTHFATWETFSPWGLLRKDGDYCYPEILRLNWQIYYEVIPLWYGTGRFHLWISNVVNFLDQTTLLSGSVPHVLKFVTSLRVFIYVRGVNVVSTSTSSRQNNHEFLTGLGDYLAKSGTLKQLRIELSIHMPTWLSALEGSSEDLSSLLESTLCPFRDISGLSKMTTTIRFPINTNHRYRGDLMNNYRLVAKKRARVYLDAFELDMLQTTKLEFRQKT